MKILQVSYKENTLLIVPLSADGSYKLSEYGPVLVLPPGSIIRIVEEDMT